MSVSRLDKKAVTKFFQFLINGLPPEYESVEHALMHLAYFTVNSMAIMDQLDKAISPKRQKDIIEWVYKQQCVPPEHGGFRHSAAFETPDHVVEETMLTMTFAALSILVILGDDLSRVDTPRILETMKSLQQPDGSFCDHHLGSDADLRMTFCVAAIGRILGSYGDLDIEKAIEFIISNQTYEGGFSYQPGDECHGGATYCAVASLSLFGALDRIKDRKMLAYWLSQRQDDGFNGRTGKLRDTCYSFWIGSPLKVLGWFDDFVDKEKLINFIMSNYNGDGSFKPNSESDPDFIHTHFSLIGLSFCGYPGLKEVHPEFGFVKEKIPERMLHPVPWEKK